jgi:hypothetical protein
MSATTAFARRPSDVSLKRAVAVLVPEFALFPADRRSGRIRNRPKFAEKLDLTKFPAQLNLCETLAASYNENLKIEADATRPRLFFEHLDEIIAHSVRLVELLETQKGDARFLFNTVYGVSDEELDRLGELAARIDGFQTERPFEKLADQLKALAGFIELYTPALKLRIGDDRGGQSSVQRRLVPSASWSLIGQSWDVLSDFEHVTLTGDGNGDLADFVRALHQWVTGKTNSFAKNITHYASLRRRRSKAEERLKHLKRTPRKSVLEIRKLTNTVSELDFALHFGFPIRPGF